MKALLYIWNMEFMSGARTYLKSYILLGMGAYDAFALMTGMENLNVYFYPIVLALIFIAMREGMDKLK